jgi:hypothetical protein
MKISHLWHPKYQPRPASRSGPVAGRLPWARRGAADRRYGPRDRFTADVRERAPPAAPATRQRLSMSGCRER